MQDHFESSTAPNLGIDFTTYISEVDGTIVVHIDTNDRIPEDSNGPRIRVYLNDGSLYENPPFPQA